MPGKSDEAKMAKLIRKTMKKAEQKPKDKNRRKFDPTLRPETEDDLSEDRKIFFSDMKKREF